MRGREVDIRIVFVIETASFPVGVVGSGKFFEIACTPGIDSNHKDCEYKSKEDDNTAKVCAVSLLD